jgi:hypothetical protein
MFTSSWDNIEQFNFEVGIYLLRVIEKSHYVIQAILLRYGLMGWGV